MPLQIPDQSIASQIKVPDAMHTLNSIMQFKNAQQNLQSNQLNYEIADQANQKRNQLRDLAAKSLNPDGTFNQSGFNGQAPQIDPEQGLRLGGEALTNQNQGITNKSNEMAYQNAQTNKSMQILSSLASDKDVLTGTPKGTQKIIQSAIIAHLSGVDPDHVNTITTALIHTPAEDRPQLISNMQRAMLSPEQQRADENPNVIMPNNGQEQIPFNISARYAGGIGPINGAATIQNKLPVTTQIMGDNGQVGYSVPADSSGSIQNQGLSTNGMTGTNGGMQIPQKAQANMNSDQLAILQQERANEKNPANQQALDREIARVQMSLSKNQQNSQQRQFVPASLPAGAAAAIAGTQDQVTKHYADVQQAANNAQQDIGVLQNIISHAHGAATGVGAERQALAQAILGKLGISADQAATTDTNLLMKNSAMLQLAGGDTNLAKTLAGAANPNNHMDEDAIKKAAYQVIGQKKMAVAAQGLFGPLKQLADHGSPEAYNQVLQKYNSAADPRIMQLPYMSKEEIAKMRGSMTQKEQAEFRDKINTLKSLGINP